MLDFFIIFLTVFYKYFLMNTRTLWRLYYLLLGFICILCLIKLVSMMLRDQIPRFDNWRVRFIPVVLYVLFVTALSQDANFALPLILGISFSTTDYTKVVRHFLFASLLCFVGQLCLYAAGVTTSNSIHRVVDGERVVRSSLGFETPNIVFCYFLPIFLCAYILLNRTRYRVFFYIFAYAVVLLLYSATRSRTSLVLMTVFVIVALLLGKNAPIKPSASRFFTPLLFFLFIALSYFVAKIAGKDPESFLVVLMTGRPYIWNSYLIRRAPLIGPGNKAILQSWAVLPQYGTSLDNYFVYFWHCFGLIPLAIMGAFYGKLLFKLGESRQKELVFSVIVYLIFGLIETNTIIASTNFILIFIYAVLFNPNYFSSQSQHVEKNTYQAIGVDDLSRRENTENGGISLQ